MVHGSDGLDEITTTGPTLAFEIRDGAGGARERWSRRISECRRRAPEDLKGGDQEQNLRDRERVLGGARGPQRDIVLVNAAAALVAAGKAETFLEGVALAVVSIDSGAARGKVEDLARIGR